MTDAYEGPSADFPVELLLHIFAFIPPLALLDTLCNVNEHWRGITAMAVGTDLDLSGYDARQTVSDAMLWSIAQRFPSIRRLTLDGCTRVSEAGVAAIATMPQLQHLSMKHLQFSVLAAAHLTRLVKVEYLDVRYHSVRGMQHLL